MLNSKRKTGTAAIAAAVLLLAAPASAIPWWKCWEGPLPEGEVDVVSSWGVLPMIVESRPNAGTLCTILEFGGIGWHSVKLRIVTSRVEYEQHARVYVPALDDPMRADLAPSGTLGVLDLSVLLGAMQSGWPSVVVHDRAKLRARYTCDDPTQCSPWGLPATSCREWGDCLRTGGMCACRLFATPAEIEAFDASIVPEPGAPGP